MSPRALDDRTDGCDVRAVTDAVAAHVVADGRVCVALSGGIDSMVLLDAATRVAAVWPLRVSALHVHHGLSPNADRWSAFCEAQCAARGISIAVDRVKLHRHGGQSLEAVARTARYKSLAAADADAILLAHHADDQAETILLQLMRGAGPHGLAGMSVRRDGRPAWVRPLLQLSRAQLRSYAVARDLQWIDDESNADHRYRRNFLRGVVSPSLVATFPGYPSTLVRAAAHQAEAAMLLDELAALDAVQAVNAQGLDRAYLGAISAARARNLLRWYLRRAGLRAPSTAQLANMLTQLGGASTDAQTRIAHDGMEIGCHRGRVVLHLPSPATFAQSWSGEARIGLPGGVVTFERVIGDGMAAAPFRQRGATLRSRVGGERIRLASNRPHQTVKKLLHDRGVPQWERYAIPLLWCGDELAAIPGIGVAISFQAAPDEAGWRMTWHPRTAKSEAPST
jgi:tRNA(Ile)-lysidine synthase